MSIALRSLQQLLFFTLIRHPYAKFLFMETNCV